MFRSFDPHDPLATFAFASNGLVSSRSEGTGVSGASYGWDDFGRLTSQSDTFSGGTNNVAWTFAYNPASQIVTQTRDNDSYGFTKTTASTAYAVNGLNQYTAVGGATHSYDANGNLTGTGSVTYTYDIENRLVKAVAGATTTNLVYDPLGRLFEVNQGTSATTTRFLTDGDAMVVEYNSQNDVTNRLVHGSNAAADDPLVWYSGSNLANKRWLHADHLGSIVAWTNSSGGSPTINKYDEYGLPAATNTGRFQYTGQAWIGELGLYYYKARMYSALLGRFMQTDPVGYEGGINLYAYVTNDPVNSLDATGLICTGSLIESSCGGGGLAFGASGFSTASATGRIEYPIKGPALTDNSSASTPSKASPISDDRRSSRPLDAREKAFYTHQFPDDLLNRVILVRGLPWYVDASRFVAITFDTKIFLRDGLGSFLSSPDRAELGGHELSHVWQYRQGMTVSSYIREALQFGYDRHPRELQADLIGLQSRENYCSAIGGEGC